MIKVGKYTFHTDPGHGWLEVPQAELERLGILDKISHYSYQSRFAAINAPFCYLEEDCDAAIFHRAKEEAQESYRIEERHIDRDHWIRELPPMPEIKNDPHIL
jgi:hypothetical protein